MNLKFSHLIKIVQLLLICVESCYSLAIRNVESDISQNPSKFQSEYLTPEKCRRNHKTKFICNLLSKSKKFQSGYRSALDSSILTIPQTTTSTTTPQTVLNLEERSYFDFYDDEEKIPEIEYTYNFPEYLENSRSKNHPRVSNMNKILRNLRTPRFRHIKPFKMKRFLSVIWPKVIKARNFMAQAPITAVSLPLLWTMGIGLFLKNQVKKSREIQDANFNSAMVKNPPTWNPAMNITATPKNDPASSLKRRKLKMATQVLGLTSESINLATQKINLVNSLARAADLSPLKIGPFLASQKLNVNSTLLNSIKNFKSRDDNDIRYLIGDFVQVVAQQAIKNATAQIISG